MVRGVSILSGMLVFNHEQPQRDLDEYGIALMEGIP
jgi:hypothetical protein